jgi:hypothetical protein
MNKIFSYSEIGAIGTNLNVTIVASDADLLSDILTTWCFMYQDITHQSAYILKEYILAHNLCGVLKEFEEIKYNLVRSQFDDIIVPVGHPLSCIDFYTVMDSTIVCEFLTFLTFLKRLTLPHTSLNNCYEDETLFTFLDNAYRLEHWAMPAFDSDLCRSIRRYSNQPIPFDENVFQLPVHQYLENIGKKYTYNGKWGTLSRYIGRIDPKLGKYFHSTQCEELPDYNQYMIVPKNAFKGRSICIESVGRTFSAYRFSIPWANQLTAASRYAKCWYNDHQWEYIPVGACSFNYQRANQVLALHASFYDDLITYDFSNASDSITYNLTSLLHPRALKVYEHYDLLSKYTMIDGKKEEFPMLFTMGHPLTYNEESHIFRSIAYYACDKASCNKDLVGIVGDDVILPKEAGPYFEDACHRLALELNHEKSFTSGPYRESCGVEAYKGKDVSPVYFPRSISQEKYALYVGIQHKVYNFPTANTFISLKVKELYSKTTYSSIGSEFLDLWGQGSSVGYKRKQPNCLQIMQFRPPISMQLTEDDYVSYILGNFCKAIKWGYDLRNIIVNDKLINRYSLHAEVINYILGVEIVPIIDLHTGCRIPFNYSINLDILTEDGLILHLRNIQSSFASKYVKDDTYEEVERHSGIVATYPKRIQSKEEYVELLRYTLWLSDHNYSSEYIRGDWELPNPSDIRSLYLNPVLTVQVSTSPIRPTTKGIIE